MDLHPKWVNPLILFAKELNHLHDAGYLDKVKNDNKIEYQANTKHPLYDILKSGPKTFRFRGYSGDCFGKNGKC